MHNSATFTQSCLKQGKVTFNLRNIEYLFIVYKLPKSSQDLNTVFTLKDCSLWAVKLTKNAEPDKYSYSTYGIGFDSRSVFTILNSYGKKVIIFGIDNSSLVHVDNEKNYILDIGEGLRYQDMIPGR